MPDYTLSDKMREMARHFARISNMPLKRQNSSDAWNERDNKLVAARTAAQIHIKASLERGRARQQAELDEILPEDLAEAMTVPQAFDRKHQLDARYATSLPGEWTKQDAKDWQQANQDLGLALRKQRFLDEQGYGAGSITEDIKRRSGEILPPIAKGAAVSPLTWLPDMVGMMLMGPGQMGEMEEFYLRDKLGVDPTVGPDEPPVSGQPWRDIVGLSQDDLWGAVGELLNPLDLLASAIAKGPAVAKAITFPFFWKVVRGSEADFFDQVFNNEFMRRRFLQQVPGAEWQYGQIKIPEESMDAARQFAESRGMTFTDDMNIHTGPPVEGQPYEFEARLNDSEGSPRFTKRPVNVVAPKPDATGKFRITQYTDDVGTTAGQIRQDPDGLGKQGYFINSTDELNPGMSRQEFEVDAGEAYDFVSDPDGLWQSTGVGEVTDEMLDAYLGRIKDAGYKVAWQYRDNQHKAFVLAPLNAAKPKVIYAGSKNLAARQSDKAGRFDIVGTNANVRFENGTWELYNEGKRVDFRTLDNLFSNQGNNNWKIHDVTMNMVEEGDTWTVHQISGGRRGLDAFRDLLANADLSGKTLIFDDPAKSMLAFSDSSYIWAGRNRTQIPLGEGIDIGGGWKRLLKEQFDFKEVNGKWVREPQQQRTSFLSPEYAVQYASDELGLQARGIRGNEMFDMRNPTPEEKKFIDLADMQRGEPEKAMVRAQHHMGGGVLSVAIEHVGDLTHRMSERYALGADMGYEYVKPKVQRALSLLRQPYGFEKEVLENYRSNARFRNVDPIAFQQETEALLQEYARQHLKLPVYNDMQEAARDAAVALGEGNYWAARTHLEKLEEVLEQGPEAWAREASKVR
jgi:hypothetical protein